MDWNTLLSVVVGGLIALVPVIISNRFQAKEREKDREEARRETKIRAREKWIERDILDIRDSVNIVLDELSLGRRLSYKADISPDLKGKKILPDKESPTEVKTHLERAFQSSEKLYQALTKIHNLSTSFDGKIQSESKIFLVTAYEYISLHARRKENNDKWLELCNKAGKLQKELREKLISIRE